MRGEVDPGDYLRRLGAAMAACDDSAVIDIAEAGLMLAALDHPNQSLGPYREHLADLGLRAKTETSRALDAENVGRGLTRILSGHYAYEGDRQHYDDPHNADLISVIDRRRGLPVALGILYIHAARASGFEARGLYAPGHFLLSVTAASRDVLIDPFIGGAAMEHERFGVPPQLVDPASVADPRALLAVSDIDVLLRLQFNIKTRAIQAGDNARAAEITERMLLIAPKRPELWFDLAKLNEEQGMPGAARRAVEQCLTLVKPGEALHNEAQFALSALKRRLN